MGNDILNVVGILVVGGIVYYAYKNNLFDSILNNIGTGVNTSSTNNPVVSTPTSSAGTGPDGVSFIYPTSGFTWYIGPNGFDAHLEKGGGSTFSKLVKNTDGSFTADASKGSARFNLNPPTDYEKGGDAIGVCKMNFADSVKRGYTWKPTDLKNIEFTGFFKVNSPTTNGGIYMRGPCNHHPSQADCCENANYDMEVSTGSNSSVIFTKQAPKTYTPDPAGRRPISPSVKLEGHGWFGLKYVHIILSSDPNNPRVLLQAFINLNGDGKSWKKIAETIDHNKYNWGSEGAMCGGTPSQVLAFGAPRVVFKWYSGDVDFKKMSLRSIKPNISNLATAKLGYIYRANRVNII